MRLKFTRVINFILVITIVAQAGILASATTIKDVQNQIKDTENKIDNINSKIDALSDEQDILEEEMSDLNAEIINMMASIELKEEEIESKEIAINDTEDQIDVAEAEYYEAKAREEKQYAEMLVRIKFMYENSSESIVNVLIQGDGFEGILNRMDYIERVYEYDQAQYTAFLQTKQEVQDLWDLLVVIKDGLVEEKNTLEAEKTELMTVKAELDVLLEKKKAESASFEAEIKKYKQEASVAKKLLQQEKKKLQQLQSEQNKGTTAAATGSYTSTNYTSVIDGATGSDLGKRLAKYACQYIGNPYVAGGTSLTNGADCSGFIYRLYQDFGYTSFKRVSSYELRSVGTEVSYSDAQPGDIICYEGHVALYIGGGLIVHASSAKTGIKISNATYKTILTVRRVI